MSSYLKYAVMTVQLADSRILLTRKNHGGWPQWSATHEAFLSDHESPLDAVNDLLYVRYGIDGDTYDDDFVEIKQIPPFEVLPNRRVFPFIMKLKKRLTFKVQAMIDYRAIDWYDLVDEVIMNASGNFERHQYSIYSPTAMFTVKGLHKRKVFD